MGFGFESRVGIAGLAVGLIGIAIAILWPDKKWVGWTFLAIGAGILLLWGVLEIKQWIESPRLSLFVSIVLGCILGGGMGALMWSSARLKESIVPKSTSTNGENTGVQLSITCDTIGLPMAYTGDVWALNTAVLPEPVGLFKISSPPNAKVMWPEEGVNGFGYKCTVKNYGSQPAFAASFILTVDVLGIIRTESGWKEGEIKKSRTVIAEIPRPLSPQGIDEFSFYICSYDPDGALEIKLPSFAFINSDDAKNKQQVSLRSAGALRGNKLSVAPKNPFPKRHGK